MASLGQTLQRIWNEANTNNFRTEQHQCYKRHSAHKCSGEEFQASAIVIEAQEDQQKA